MMPRFFSSRCGAAEHSARDSEVALNELLQALVRHGRVGAVLNDDRIETLSNEGPP